MSFLRGVALVTGAGSGIGQATAIAYARAGCTSITIADVSEKTLQETSAKITGQWPRVNVLVKVVDVSSQVSVEAMVSQTVEAFGSLNYAANVAGVTCRDRCGAAEHTAEEFDRVHNVNTRGLLFCVQAEVKAMLKQKPSVSVDWCDARRAQRGSIVNIASTCGSTAIPNIMPYVVSKHAVVGITRAFAIDYGKDGIRINAVCPGLVETPMLLQRKALTAQAESKNGGLKALSDPPLGRLALPEEVADSCVFASSSVASYMHGAMLMADGGKTAEY